jgi:hypothetical protein
MMMMMMMTMPYLIFNDLHTHLDTRVVLQQLLAPHVHPHRRVELERVAARGHFGVAEYHADLLLLLYRQMNE